MDLRIRPTLTLHEASVVSIVQLTVFSNFKRVPVAFSSWNFYQELKSSCGLLLSVFLPESSEGCSNHVKGNIEPFAVALTGATVVIVRISFSFSRLVYRHDERVSQVASLTVSVGSDY